MKEESYLINIEEHKKLAIEHFKLIVDLLTSIKMDYWIEYGTMLGAVREKGFIPWDSEFDVGIWSVDFERNKKFLLDNFSKKGFNINTSSKDRIKLTHKDLLVGAYTIDLHTYHLKDGIAFVSYNRGKRSLGFRIYKFLQRFDKRRVSVIPMAGMIKEIMKTATELPKEFLFTKYNYKSKYQFKIEFNNIKIKRKDKTYSLFKNNVKRCVDYLIETLISIIPQKTFHKLIDALENKFGLANQSYEKVQAIPAHYYLNLTELPFEHTRLKGPTDKIAYIESIYGKDWHIGKPDWASTQNNINKDIKSI